MRKLLTVVTIATMALGSGWAVAADAPPPPPAGQHDGMGMGKPHGGMMEKMDTDKDGTITRAEHDAFTAKRFTEMDANKDGKVTQEEMQKHRQEKWGGKGRKHHGGCEGRGEHPAMPPKE